MSGGAGASSAGSAGAAGGGGASGSGGAAAGGAGVGGAGAKAGGNGSGGCESFVPCCDATGKSVQPACVGGFPQCPPGSAFPASGVCMPSTACTPTSACGTGAYCDYPDDLCGAGAVGVCKPKPLGCDASFAPICGCDGQVASSDCAAQSNGVDRSAKGGCAVPPKTFACGPIFCQGAPLQYCAHDVSDVAGQPDGWACKSAPPACSGAPSCGCLAKEPCGASCSGDSMGNWTLTCAGG